MALGSSAGVSLTVGPSSCQRLGCVRALQILQRCMFKDWAVSERCKSCSDVSLWTGLCQSVGKSCSDVCLRTGLCQSIGKSYSDVYLRTGLCQSVANHAA